MGPKGALRLEHDGSEKPHRTTYTVVTKEFGFYFQITQSDVFKMMTEAS